MIVIHYTAMATAQDALERLCDPVAEVSAHYLIDADGTLCQLVDEDKRAWHAGAGAWGGVTDVNSRSIGIELANNGLTPFSEPQMAALERLLAGIMARWSIRPERVIGHSDMAPTRKGDPGARFDWRRLARLGLSVWPAGARVGDFAADAKAFGYTAPEGACDPDGAVLNAFRLRFRPWASGPLDDADRAIMHDLARRFPVDRTPPST
ncbi:N-acetylmuramoyl-L-alanine amidase [Actibacterium lipolyticum]|nr:N-acetylmuramoyl-L-alanine amidase [Actibacterium lipolyticum]